MFGLMPIDTPNRKNYYSSFDFTQVKVQIKRQKMVELPETDDGIAQWCKDTFVAKVSQERTYFCTTQLKYLLSDS